MKKNNILGYNLDGGNDTPASTLEGGYDTPIGGVFKKYVLGLIIPVCIPVYATMVIVARFGTLYIPNRFRTWKVELSRTDAVLLGTFYASLALCIRSHWFYRHSRRRLAIQGLTEFTSLLGIGVSLIGLAISFWRNLFGY